MTIKQKTFLPEMERISQEINMQTKMRLKCDSEDILVLRGMISLVNAGKVMVPDLFKPK